MTFNREALQQWLAARNPRESALVYTAGFFVVYMFWNVLFGLSLHHRMVISKQHNLQLLSEYDVQKNKLSSIESVISNSSFIRDFAAQEQLTNKSNSIEKMIKKMELNFIPLDKLTKVTSDIISQQEEVTLLSLKSFSQEPWLNSTLTDVYKHKMQIEFRGTYFNTIEFLGYLEKLPWHLYWDNIDYKVLTYPEADVVAQFYVLSNQKS